jgi:hypothetical protein
MAVVCCFIKQLVPSLSVDGITVEVKAAEGSVSEKKSSTATTPSASTGTGALTKVESFRLDESKVVVDVSRLEEDAQAIVSLRDRVLSLSQQLEDERQDSVRQESELKAVSQLLAERDSLLNEQRERIAEVQVLCEAVQSEKNAISAELNSLQISLEEAQNKARFDLAEAEASLSRVKAENESMQQEIAQLSGDNVVPSKSSSSNNNSSNSNNAIGFSQEDEDNISTKTPTQSQSASRRGGTLSPAIPEASASASTSSSSLMALSSVMLSPGERKELLDLFTTQYLEICREQRVGEQSMTNIFALVDALVREFEGGFTASEKRIEKLERHYGKRMKDLEDQRSRLEKDLQSRMENVSVCRLARSTAC